MSHGNEKWPAELDGVIREAIVAGKLRPVDCWQKVVAGTLDGLDPIPIPRRTFYARWTTAQRELRKAEAAPRFPRLIHRLTIQIIPGWEDLGPEELADRLNERFPCKDEDDEAWTPAMVAEVLDAIVEHRNIGRVAPVGRNV